MAHYTHSPSHPPGLYGEIWEIIVQYSSSELHSYFYDFKESSWKIVIFHRCTYKFGTPKLARGSLLHLLSPENQFKYYLRMLNYLSRMILQWAGYFVQLMTWLSFQFTKFKQIQLNFHRYSVLHSRMNIAYAYMGIVARSLRNIAVETIYMSEIKFLLSKVRNEYKNMTENPKRY